MAESKTLISVRLNTKYLDELKAYASRENKTITDLIEEGVVGLRNRYMHNKGDLKKSKKHPLYSLFGMLSKEEGENLLKTVRESRESQIDESLKHNKKIDKLLNV